MKMKAGHSIVNTEMEIVERPPPMKAGEFVANPEDKYWLKVVKKRSPDLVLPKYWDAYKKYLEGVKGWTSHSKVAKQLDLAKSTVTQMFGRIEGHMKRTMGYEFERILAKQYLDSSLVIDVEPDGTEPAPAGKPDLIVYLTSGAIRIVSIKSHNENESITIKKSSPEVKLLKRLQKREKEAHMVVEGLFEGRFFSVPYNLDTKKKSVRITDDVFNKWPPVFEKLLGNTGQPVSNRVESSPHGPDAPRPDAPPGTEPQGSDVPVESDEMEVEA
jgi:hypothetical protein